jgi:transposase-like protein
LIPWLYLKGVSSNNMQDALSALLGSDAPNLSPDTISRLTKSWAGELDSWARRDLSARRYVYLWADGIYFQAKTDTDSQCILVIIGATPEGKRSLSASLTAIGRAHKAGANCCSISKRAA